MNRLVARSWSRVANTVVFVAAMFVMAAVTNARAADALTMRLEWSPYVMHMPLYLAADKGWFKAAGLDVHLEDGNGSMTAVQLVGNDRFDLGHGALATMAIGSAKGLGITSLASYMTVSPLGIIYAKDRGIASIKDFAGKKVIYTPASAETPFLEPFFLQAGLPDGSVNLIGVDASAKLSSYITGVGDAFVALVPSDLPHVAEQRPSNVMLFAKEGLNLPTFGIFANEDALKQKGPAIRRFVGVVTAAWEYILDGHEREAAEAIMRQRPDAPTSVERLVAEFKENKPFISTDAKTFTGAQSAEDWAKAIKVMEVAKVVPAGTTPTKYFSNDYNDVAYGRKIVGIAP